MTLSPSTIDEAAAQLFAADANSAPIGQLTQRYPGMEVADAYAIQQVNLARRLAGGRTLDGEPEKLIAQALKLDAEGQAAAAAVQVGASASQAVQAPSAAETASVALSAAQNATTAVPSQSATAAHVAFASATQVTALPSQVATFGLAVPRECLADQLTASPQTAASAAVLVLAGTTQELLMPSAAAHVGWAHAEAPHGNDRLWNAGRTSRVVAGIRNNQRTTPYAPAAPPAPAPAVETSVSLWRAGRTARVVSKVRSTVAERALSPLPDQDRQASAAANQNCLPPDQTAVVNLF